MTYKINFTDPSKKSKSGDTGFFLLNDDSTNGPLGPSSTETDPGATQSETSILIYGKNVPDYGERIGENFVQMLESFSSPVPPSFPSQGQVWNRTGLSFLIVGYNNNDKNVVISGDWVTRINEVIAEPYYSTGTTVNPYGTIRILNVDTQTSIEARPTNTFLNGSQNTVIQFEATTLPNIDYTSTTNYVTLASTHNQLMVYVDGTREPYIGDPKWIQIQSVVFADEAPEQVDPGTIWISTSGSPADDVARIYLNGGFSEILTELGGTLINKLFYPQALTVTDDYELVPKKYVDDEIAAASAGTSGDIAALQSQVDDHETRISNLETDLPALETSFNNYVISNDGAISSINNDIANINIDLGNKLDLSGGTMSGDINFVISENTPSDGITWLAATGATFEGHGIDYSSIGVTADNVVYYSALISAPAGANNSALNFDYQAADDVNPVNLLSLRKNGVAASVPVYEQVPGLPGTAFSAVNKYQTETDVNGIISGIGNILLADGNFSWNAPTWTLSFGGTLSPVDIDLSHSHTSSDFVVTYDHSVINTFQSLPYVEGAQVFISPAISTLDTTKAARINPLIDEGRSVEHVDLVTFNAATDELTVLTADIDPLAVEIGDPLYVFSTTATGNFIVDFSASTNGPIASGDATGLTAGSTYTLELTVDFRADLTFIVSDTGANLATWGDIVNAINTAVNPSATATITGGNLVITSATTGQQSDVTITNFEMIEETSAFALAVPPVYDGVAGADPEVIYETTVANIVVGAPNTVITTTIDLVSVDPADYGTIAVASVAANPDSIATVKLLDVTYDPRLFGWGVDVSDNPYLDVDSIDVSGTFAFDGATSGLPAGFDGVSSVQVLRLPGETVDDATEFAIQNEEIYVRTKSASSPSSPWTKVLTELDIDPALPTDNEVLVWQGI